MDTTLFMDIYNLNTNGLLDCIDDYTNTTNQIAVDHGFISDNFLNWFLLNYITEY